MAEGRILGVICGSLITGGWRGLGQAVWVLGARGLGGVGTGVWALRDPWWQSAAAGGVEGLPPSPRDRQKASRGESGFEFAGI